MNKQNIDFFSQVYQVVRLIPHGRASSYGAIAAYLGAKTGARMVGWAMNNSHTLPDKIPAHRVVNRNGLLTGKAHFADPNAMQNQLEQEGIEVIDSQIQHFDKVFWDPMKELGL